VNAEEKLARIRDIHHWEPDCENGGSATCGSCGLFYPCPTVQIIDEAELT
jgi:hypothetical protein